MSKELKPSQSKWSDDSISTPPLTLFNDGKVALVKLPTKMIAPATVCKESKPSIEPNSELFEITKPPPIEVKFDKSTSSKLSFETIDNEPPNLVKVGISIDEIELLMKPNDALTASNFDKEIEEISLKVMLFAHSKSSKETSTSSELKETSNATLTVFKAESIEFNSLLLLTLKVSKVVMSNPSKVSNEVSEITRDFNEVIPVFNWIDDKAGKVTKLTVPTVVSNGKANVLKMVN